MNQLIIITLSVILAVAFAVPIDIIEDKSGQQFYLVPVHRQRRDTTLDIQGQGGNANRITIGQTGEILNIGHGNHIVTAGGLVSKPFGNDLPTSTGGTIGYQHQPTGTAVNAVVTKTPIYGTDAGIRATHTIYSDRQTKLEAFAGVNQHFGGVYGNQKPEGNVGIQFTHFFDKDYRCKLLMLGCT